MSITSSTTAQFNRNSNDIDMKAKEIERTLEPLIKQITLITKTDVSTSKRGQPMKADDLIKELVESIDYIIVHGTDIANDYPDYRNELVTAIKDVRVTGDSMIQKSKDFVSNPFSSGVRGIMVQAARELLGAVTRLLAIADMIDVQLLLKSINTVEKDLENIQNATNQRDLQRCLENYNKNSSNLLGLSGQRVNNVNDLIVRDELASCRATLKISKLMLLTSSKSRVQFGDLIEARRNNDLAVKGVCAAMNKIRDISTNKVTSEQLKHKYDKAVSLADGFDELDKQLMQTNAVKFTESSVRVNLESQINKLINSIAQLADLNNGDDNRKGKIIDQCNALKQALQDLFDLQKNKYLSGGDRDLVAIKANEMTENTRKLKQQLRKLVADQVVQCFTEAYGPLEELISAAKAGDSKRVDECTQRFLAHSQNISKVSSLACALSNDPEGISLVRLLDAKVQELSPQVANAAKILVAKLLSDVAQDNMNVYKDEWQKAVKFLIDAIDDIININYFLSSSENHILEDINRCIEALSAKDSNAFEYYSNAVKSKIARICHVVSSEMDNYEPCNYTNCVLESVSRLKNQTMISFSQSVKNNTNALRSKPIGETDENEFIDKARQVHEGIREIRNAVLFTGDYESSDSEDDGEDVNERNEVEVEDDDDDSYNIPHPSTNPEFQNKEEESMISEILRHWQTFREDKRNFDREVLKWDDKGNDIISLAKQMCAIMTDMADFSRGKGPLKSTMDVINASKKISECGAKLNKLAKNVADECPESQSKRDLEAYMNQIPLFCNQLNIAGKVKESVIDISGAPTIASLDSATSLIIASKNLMNCVLSVVKESYVASTKYFTKGGTKKPVEWKMKAPEKKPLFTKTKMQDVNLIKPILKRK